MQNEQTPAAGPTLLPCPFCGGSQHHRFNSPDEFGRPSHGVQCANECWICGPQCETEEEAAAAWNNRPHVASPASSSSVVQGDASGVERGESAGDMLSRLGMDGKRWAEEFQKTALTLGYPEMDDGWLLGWFCNAIMAGYDHARRKYDPEILAHFRPQPSGETRRISVDDLAQEIRRVDGNHSLGAGALAEALMPFLIRPAPAALTPPAEPVSRPAGEGEREAVARIIDPRAWASRDAQHRDIKGSTMHDKDRPLAYANADYYVRDSLQKADAIIALLSPAAPDAGGGEAMDDHAEYDVGEIGNYYGSLTLKREGGVDYWSIENWDGHHWSVLDFRIADAIRAVYPVSALQPGGER